MESVVARQNLVLDLFIELILKKCLALEEADKIGELTVVIELLFVDESLVLF